MTEQGDRAREIADGARGLPEGERRAFIARACAGDEALRKSVEDLLSDAGGGVQLPGTQPTLEVVTPVSGATTGVSDAGDLHPGDQLGAYRLDERIGEGGFGVVWRARQTEPVQRTVALKVIKRGMDSAAVLSRFSAERQTLALMDHPGIAQVYDAGVSETGRPYFAMEYVHGIPITEHCKRHRPSLERCLKLFAEVCQAVQHAHQKGVIHRDLKPGNILVQYVDGKASPKIIDFGIAKALNQRFTEATIFTEYGHFIGTPEYMSPEQAESSAQEVDVRADIYSLGVLLYELLTGTLPFSPEQLRRAGLLEIQRIIREVTPEKPSTRAYSTRREGAYISMDSQAISRKVRGDLDWIVMKCLEKDREHRYAWASDLAAEIERFLAGDAVEAGPPSVMYKLRKTIRRHKAGVGFAAALLLSLIGGLVGTTWGWREATAASAMARAAQIEAEASAAAEAEQRAVAVAALEREQAERTRADALTQDTLGLLGFFMSLGEDLAKLEGSIPLRDRLLERSEAFLERLEDHSRAPEKTLLALRAQTHDLVGDLLGGARNPSGADLAGARDAYDAALDVRREMAARFPETAPGLFNTLKRLGDLNRRSGDSASAAGNYAEAAAVLETIPEADRSVLEQHALALAILEVAELEQQACRLDDAVRLAERSLDLRRGVHDRVGNDSTERSLAVGHNSLAKILLERAGPGDQARAIDLARRNAEIRAALAERTPTRRHIEDLAWARTTLGQALIQLDAGADAVAELDLAIGSFADLMQRSPEDRRLRLRAMAALFERGRALRGLERFDEARADQAAGLELVEPILREAPDDGFARQRRIAHERELADLDGLAGDWAGALDRCERALVDTRWLTGADPTNAAYAERHAWVLHGVGAAALRLAQDDDGPPALRRDRLEQARAALRDAADILRAQTSPDDAPEGPCSMTSAGNDLLAEIEADLAEAEAAAITQGG